MPKPTAWSVEAVIRKCISAQFDGSTDFAIRVVNAVPHEIYKMRSCDDDEIPICHECAFWVWRMHLQLAYLPPDFAGKTNVKEWLMRLHQMSASDELTEEQVAGTMLRCANYVHSSRFSEFKQGSIDLSNSHHSFAISPGYRLGLMSACSRSFLLVIHISHVYINPYI